MDGETRRSTLRVPVTNIYDPHAIRKQGYQYHTVDHTKVGPEAISSKNKHLNDNA
jgi:hypothetical protein